MTDRTDPPSEHHARETLWNLIKDIRFGMFTTHHANGHLHSRPMTTQNRGIDEDDVLWFFMSRSTEPMRDLSDDPQVNVAYADPGEDRYVSVSGRATIDDDPATRRRLWSKMNEAWFPKGVDDPDLALVCVRISHAHYWDVKSSKLVQLYAMAKALVSGKAPMNLGETAEVRMRS
ncbi:pyridoxamine 5'-phosphate oxidase family protein [Aquabacterium humicola]|uniref:pyridoxamine 5'-phosphate oxidase family protein n=1 Tax=Aquabacterium humicola TaxID=3237377 RepID=UPI00254293FA|nr:pyridoxamine 5'-phosphate oxidase family protein [Rubrivivax pictus]